MYSLVSKGDCGGLLNLWMLVLLMKLWFVLVIRMVVMLVLVLFFLMVDIRFWCIVIFSVLIGGLLMVIIRMVFLCVRWIGGVLFVVVDCLDM